MTKEKLQKAINDLEFNMYSINRIIDEIVINTKDEDLSGDSGYTLLESYIKLEIAFTETVDAIKTKFPYEEGEE